MSVNGNYAAQPPPTIPAAAFPRPWAAPGLGVAHTQEHRGRTSGNRAYVLSTTGHVGAGPKAREGAAASPAPASTAHVPDSSDARPMENRILKHRSCEQPEDVGSSVWCQW